ncbi:MAG: 6-phosphogluconolactonase [Gammaproteobacteria bacterium]
MNGAPSNVFPPPPRQCGGEEELARVVAGEIAETLRGAIAENNRATIALAGGSTPARCYRLLAEFSLEWGRVTVMPTDERRVSPSHPRSNERMIKETLLREDAPANRSQFARLNPDIAPPVLDLALLGMGEDLHIASLFPDAPDNDSRAVVRAVSPDGEARLSLTLPALLSARRIVLMFAGEKKRRAFFAAPLDSPVGKLLTSSPATAEVFCD